MCFGRRRSDARAYYEKTLAIRKTLAEETKTVNRCDDLAIPSYRLGCIESLPNKRTDLLREAPKIWEALMQACPDDPAYKERYDAVKEMLDS